MKIYLTSIFVNNQDEALKFYTEVLGFVKKDEVPLGEFKWLTVVSPEGPGEIELLLEPNENSAAQTYQKALFEGGIPAAQFKGEDIHAEYRRLTARGVKFTVEPTRIDNYSIAVFDDTCGNLIQIVQIEA